MATNSHRLEGRTNEDGGNLNQLLDVSQLSELISLVTGITESMRQMLLQQAFDNEPELDRTYSKRFLAMTNDEKMMITDPSAADVPEHDRQRRLVEQRERINNSAKTKTLRQDSLDVFDDWKKQLLKRISQAVGRQEAAKDQPEAVRQRTLETQSCQRRTMPIFESVMHNVDGRPKLRTRDIYPPIKNALTKLAMEKRTLTLHSVLLLVLSMEHYSAHSRTFLLLLTSSLKLPLRTLEQDEIITARGLLEAVRELTAAHETKNEPVTKRSSGKWRVGVATAAGVAVVGVAGGIAAPLVAAGVNSIMGGLGLGATSAAAYLGSFAGNAYLVGTLFGAYGGRMTGQMMENYAKEVEGFKFVPINNDESGTDEDDPKLSEIDRHRRRLRVTICISGWLTQEEGVIRPWRIFGTSAEVFALEYELETQLKLGNAMRNLVQSAAWGYAQKKLIETTVFADLAAALWPIGLAKAARLIDNPFSIAKQRSEKAGVVLADALINRAQGERPVTLIGFSLGARVIYRCLLCLAERRAFGLIENAVLMGAPTPSDTDDWRMMRSVISGRLINAYSTNDYVLSFMYRTSSLQYGIAGLQAIQGVLSVENVDVSDQITGHLRYEYCVGTILKRIAIEDLNKNNIDAEQVLNDEVVVGNEAPTRNIQPGATQRQLSTGTEATSRLQGLLDSNRADGSARTSVETFLADRALLYLVKPSSQVRSSSPVPVAAATQGDGKKKSQLADMKSGANPDSTSTSSIVQKAYQNMPSIPYITRPTAQGPPRPVHASPPSSNDDSSATTKNASHSGGYMSRAVEYLPSLSRRFVVPGALAGDPSRSAPVDRPNLTKAHSNRQETCDRSG